LIYFLGGAGYGLETAQSSSRQTDDDKTFYEKGSVFAYRMLQESA
jgi:hypothetical protein